MNVGQELISKALTHGDLVPLIDTGFNEAWLKAPGSGSEVIFTGIDKQAFGWMLSHWKKHHISPSTDIFREHFPEGSYPLASTDVSLDELIDLAVEKVNSYLISEIIAKTIDLHDAGNISRAVAVLQSESARIGSDLRMKQDRADSLNDLSFDIEEMLKRTVEMGIPFGISDVDDAIFGFQKGQLATVLGRQKSGKTTFMLNSALQAWEEGYDVLFFSVEMDIDMLRQRLYSLGAHVSPSRFRRGTLKEHDQNKVRAFHNRMTEDEQVSFYISKKRALITVDDIMAEIRLYKPHVVYIDGFNFMLDRHTKKMTDDWQANENVAAELKSITLEEDITIVVSTQVREKQYHAKSGIEAKTIASGSGLLQSSDFVLGLDKEGMVHTINCVLSRYEWFEPVVAELNWDTMEIEIVRDPGYDFKGREL